MEYIFGDGILKVVGKHHTDLEDWQEIVREFPQETITDRFRVVKKIDTKDDAEGRCYDWYEIDKHYRMIDRTKPVAETAEQNKADLDYIAMMTGVDLMDGGEI